jgi:hypothetical protein
MKTQYVTEDWLGNQKAITLKPTNRGHCCLCGDRASHHVSMNAGYETMTDRYCPKHSLVWFPVEAE